MGIAWTTDNFLTSLKNSQMIPDASAGSLSPAALLQFATDQLYMEVVPMIMAAREKYYETYQDTPYNLTTPSLTIPYRAIGGTVSDVAWLYQYDVQDLTPIDPASTWTTQPSTRPSNFYFQNNAIVFFPPPLGSYGTIRLRYQQRPNQLAQTSACAQITAFNSMTGVVSCNAPSSWASINLALPQNYFDFIPTNAAQATPYAIDQQATGVVSATSVTFSTLPTGIAIGDWLALANTTPIPEIPFEFQTVLVQSTAKRALGAVKDLKGAERAEKDLNQYMINATKMISPRDRSGRKRVVAQWRQF